MRKEIDICPKCDQASWYGHLTDCPLRTKVPNPQQFVKPTLLKETNVGYAASTGAPVPSAGDVFVQRYAESCGEGGGVYAISNGDLCDYHHVTRLTAENDAIRLQAGGMQMTIDELTAERDGLHQLLEQKDSVLKATEELWDTAQSELTKARELLTDVKEFLAYPDANLMDEVNAFLAIPTAHNVDESCGQDAEGYGPDEHLMRVGLDALDDAIKEEIEFNNYLRERDAEAAKGERS